MSIEVFKKLGSKEQYEYLKNLDYQPCNLPNVGVHYGDVRSICLSGNSSAYISEGHVKSFTEQNAVGVPRFVVCTISVGPSYVCCSVILLRLLDTLL